MSQPASSSCCSAAVSAPNTTLLCCRAAWLQHARCQGRAFAYAMRAGATLTARRRAYPCSGRSAPARSNNGRVSTAHRTVPSANLQAQAQAESETGRTRRQLHGPRQLSRFRLFAAVRHFALPAIHVIRGHAIVPPGDSVAGARVMVRPNPRESRRVCAAGAWQWRSAVGLPTHVLRHVRHSAAARLLAQVSRHAM
eukprot:1723816-Rhodomonas_salina.2